MRERSSRFYPPHPTSTRSIHPETESIRNRASPIELAVAPAPEARKKLAPGVSPGNDSQKYTSAVSAAQLQTAHTHECHLRVSQRKNHSPNFSAKKAAVRTDAALTDTNSKSRTQTTQIPTGPGSSPSRGYPPNTPLQCKPLANHLFFVFNHLTRCLLKSCSHQPTLLPSNSNTLHSSPRTSLPLPASDANPPGRLSSFSHPTRMAEGPQRQPTPNIPPCTPVLPLVSTLPALSEAEGRADLSALCVMSPAKNKKAAQPKPCRPPIPVI